MRNFAKHIAAGIIMGAILIGGVVALTMGCRAFNFNDTVYKNVTITEKYRVNKNSNSYWIVLGENPDNGDLEIWSLRLKIICCAGSLMQPQSSTNLKSEKHTI